MLVLIFLARSFEVFLQTLCEAKDLAVVEVV